MPIRSRPRTRLRHGFQESGSWPEHRFEDQMLDGQSFLDRPRRVPDRRLLSGLIEGSLGEELGLAQTPIVRRAHIKPDRMIKLQEIVDTHDSTDAPDFVASDEADFGFSSLFYSNGILRWLRLIMIAPPRVDVEQAEP